MRTKLSPSGIPHARLPECARSKDGPPDKVSFDLFSLNLIIPGTISAVSKVALVKPPSRTIESGREGGIQAV